MKLRHLLLLLLAVCLLSAAVWAQSAPAAPAAAAPKAPPLSPPGQAEFAFADGKKITITYSRPLMRGRKIMGDLVPYGKVWRTGANAATSLVTDTDLVVANARVPAGKYTLYTVPGEQTWTIIINKQTGQWGLRYDQAQDLVRVEVMPVKLRAAVDQFTIRFDREGPAKATLKIEWENTSVPVPVSEAGK